MYFCLFNIMAHTALVCLIILELSTVYGFLFELKTQKANAECKLLFNCPTMCIGYNPMTSCPLCMCGAPPVNPQAAPQSSSQSGTQQQQFSYQSQSGSGSGTVQQTGELLAMGGNLFQMLSNNDINLWNTDQPISQGEGDNPANPNNVNPGMPLSGLSSIDSATSPLMPQSTFQPTPGRDSTSPVISSPPGTQISPTRIKQQSVVTSKSTRSSFATIKFVPSASPVTNKATHTLSVATLPTSDLSTSELPPFLLTSPPVTLQKRQSVPTTFFSTDTISSTAATSQPASSATPDANTHRIQATVTINFTKPSSSPNTPTIEISKKTAIISNLVPSTSTQGKLKSSSPTPPPTPFVCPGDITCSLVCLVGYVNDSQGCPICQCAEVPHNIP